eukprot:COSAG06_NODE_2380_length_6981_cov_38.221738_3_plen_154_part_00
MAPRLAELPQSKLPTSHSTAPVAHGPHLCPRAERLCAATRAALVVVGCYCCRSRSYTMTTNQTHCETVTAPCATRTPAPTPGTRVAPIIRAQRVTAAKSRGPSERTARGNCVSLDLCLPRAIELIGFVSPRATSSGSGLAEVSRQAPVPHDGS